jgi:hypothetical protein
MNQNNVKLIPSRGFSCKESIRKIHTKTFKIQEKSMRFMRKNRRFLIKVLSCTVCILIFKARIAFAQQVFDQQEELVRHFIMTNLVANISELLAKKKRAEELALVGKTFLTTIAEQRAKESATKLAQKSAQALNSNLIGGQLRNQEKTGIVIGRYSLVALRAGLANLLLNPIYCSNKILRKKINSAILGISALLSGSDYFF